jgi:hypothetical protein
MDWKTLIAEIQARGLSQSEIGAELGKSQAWVSAVAAGKYGDLKWADGEALRKLHIERCPQKIGAGDTAPEAHQATV